MRDPKCERIVFILEEFRRITFDNDYFEDAKMIMDWLVKNNDIDLNFIRCFAPKKIKSTMLTLFAEYLRITDDPDIADEVFGIRKKISPSFSDL